MYALNSIYSSQQTFSTTMSSFPSYEEVRTSDSSARLLPIKLTPEAYRLFWSLQGPLASAISVMSEDWREKGSTSREPYVQANTLANSGTTTKVVHPIASASLTEPKIGSITVTVYALEMWEQQWLGSHEAHAEPGRPDCLSGELPAVERIDESEIDSDEEDHGDLLRCCDEDRPAKKWKLTVTPSSNLDAGGFVTVHDYLSAAHPWLKSLRSEIAQADNMWGSSPPDYYDEMFVEHQPPDMIMTTNEASYGGGMRSGPPLASSECQSYLEQLRAKAEAGDLEAAQKACFQASVQQVPHGLSHGVMQTLREWNEERAKEDCEKGLRLVFDSFKRSTHDPSDAEIEEDMTEIRRGMQESLATTIDAIRTYTI